MKDIDQEIIKFNYDGNFKEDDFYVSKSNKQIFDLLNKWPKWEKNFLNICGEDIIRTPDAIILIEWADKIIDILPPETMQINFQRVSSIENERKLSINNSS